MGSTHLIFRGAPGDQAQQFIGVKDHMDREVKAEWRKRGDNDRHWELVVPHGDAATKGSEIELPDGTEIPGGVVHTTGKTVRVDDIARLFHQSYERRAPAFGYETRPETAVGWGELPDVNRDLMVAVARDVLVELGLAIPLEEPIPGEPTEPGTPGADGARIGEPEALGDSNGGDAASEPLSPTEEPVVDAEVLDAEVVLLRGGEFDGETTSLADVEEALIEEGAIVSFEVAGATYKATDEREGDKRVFTWADGGVPFDPDAAKSEKVNDPQF